MKADKTRNVGVVEVEDVDARKKYCSRTLQSWLTQIVLMILAGILAGILDSDDEGLIAAKCRKPVTNVCAGLEELIVKAAQVQKDFPKDVKIEMPSFRCLLCHKNFPLAGYRKVCVCTVAILINLCKRKTRDCKKNPTQSIQCVRSVISNCIWKRISGSKRVR